MLMSRRLILTWTLEGESYLHKNRSGSILGAQGQETDVGRCIQEIMMGGKWTDLKLMEGVAGDKNEM